MKSPKVSFAGIAGILIFLAAAFPGMAARIKAGDGLTLQQAIDAAQPGDVISLPIMFFPGGVVIEGKTDIEIRGGAATVRPNFMGEAIGVHVLNSTNITLIGFDVRNFERGVVIENSSSCTVKAMKLDTNYDRTSNGTLWADGIVLINSHQNDISRNEIFGSGNNGILLTANSSGNTIRSNIIHDNGFQTDGIESGGSGIALDGGDQLENMITGNNVTGNRWGIYLGPAGASSDNQITRNVCTGNGRAGIAVRGGAEGNLIKANRASGNNTMDLLPSRPYDIFDDSTGGGNTYDSNKGTLGGPGL